ncbi:hypothetical protein HDU78_008833 [Chytriomyces hyalinus]|nr:hypothetical protein HDU78_008833 [Chytriomyces hyalinus]
MRPFLVVQAVMWATALASQCPMAGSPGFTSRDSIHHNNQRDTSPTADFTAIKREIAVLLKDSKDWWPADFGNYGPFMIRLAWHCSGSHRVSDGRGGCDGARIRKVPEYAWDDNTNLDKAVKLLQPVKDAHPEITWADLIILTGNAAIESMGGPKLGFCAGRKDDADGSASLVLGPTPEQEALSPCKLNGNCTSPFGPTTVGLIYVNPEGHLGNPDPALSAVDVRDTFSRMGFNDLETVALIGGGHAFGKMHGACTTGPGPNPIQSPDAPWPGTCGSGPLKGKGNNTYTSGFEGAWTRDPTEWSSEYFYNLLSYDWVKFTGPGGKNQWMPSNKDAPPIRMLTADIALLYDTEYRKIVETFGQHPEQLDKAFADAWYKLTTADMGQRFRCINADAPPAQPFQHPLPAPPAKRADVKDVMAKINQTLFKPFPQIDGDIVDNNNAAYYGAQFIDLAYQCASTFRATDYKGGCNGARIRYWPESGWPANAGLDQVRQVLQPVKDVFGEALTWSDLIVLAGDTALSYATGGKLSLKIVNGRSDAYDGNQSLDFPPRQYYSNADIEVTDNMAVMGLSPHDAVALAGRPRSGVEQKRRGLLGAYSKSSLLSNTYYKLLLSETWEPTASNPKVFESKEKPGLFMLATDVALLSNPQLKAIVQEYAQDEAKFFNDFASAWNYLMHADLPVTESASSDPPTQDNQSNLKASSDSKHALDRAVVAGLALLSFVFVL